MILKTITLGSAVAITLMSCSDVADYDDPRQFEAFEQEPSCSSLLDNGDFDDGPTSWSSSPDETIRYEGDFSHIDFLDAHSGSYFIWLGGEFGVTRTFAQTIDVPLYAGALTLEGKTIVGSEAAAGPVEDTLNLEIVDFETGSVLGSVLSWSNQDTTEGDYWSWRDFRVNISGDYSGQTIILRWTSVTNQSQNTNFLFDSLTLKPSTCF